MVFNESTPIRNLGLLPRTYNALKRYGINTVGELSVMSDEQIMNIKNFGKHSFFDLKNKLRTCAENSAENSTEYDDNSITKGSAMRFVADDAVSVLNHVDSDTIYHNYEVKFSDINGILYDDRHIDDTELPMKVKTILHKQGIHNMSSLVSADYDVVVNHYGMGSKSIKMLMDFLKGHVVINYITDKDIKLKAYTVSLYTDMNRVYPIASYNAIWQHIYNHKDAFFDMVKEYSDTTDMLSDVNAMKLVYSNFDFCSAVADSIVKSLQASPYGLSLREIENILPSSFLCTGKTRDVLMKLIGDGTIKEYGGVFAYSFVSVVDYANMIPNARNRNMFMDRLSGKTFTDIAKEHGMTRERIRQIVRIILNGRPCVYEDRYKYWFEKYNISCEDFMVIFNEKSIAYNYLCDITSKGSTKVALMPDDDKITDDMLKNGEPVFNRGIFCFENDRFTGKQINIVKAIMKNRHDKEPCDIDVLRNEYEQFCNDNGLCEKSTYRCSLHAFDANITRINLKFLLLSRGRRVRYYDMDKYDIKKLCESIAFGQHMNCVISALKIFRDNKELMEKYDIHNEYELHNIFRKNTEYLPDYVEVARMPLLNIGKIDRKQQVRDLLIQNSPISHSELAGLFNEMYGIDEASFSINWVSDFRKYCSHGIFDMKS